MLVLKKIQFYDFSNAGLSVLEGRESYEGLY